MYNLRATLFVSLAFLIILTTACTSPATPTPEPSPTERIQSLPADLPTQTAQPTLTPLPTKIFLTPTPLSLATATAVPALYTVVPTVGTAEVTQGPQSILLYEDSGNIGAWIKELLDQMNLNYTYAAGSGELLKYLQSDTEWSLILIAAENKASIQGEIWEVINKKVTEENTSLIAELWFIDVIYEGKIKSFLTGCGVELSKHYNLPRAVPVYILEPSHPIFNTPIPGISLIKPVYFWDDQAVDYLKLLPDSQAKILAGGVEGDKADNGLIISCFDDHVILQTFLNHDFPEPVVKALWQNYISYLLLQRNR
jgi:hypothetical protein